MTTLADDFSSDTGQITSFFPVVTTGTPWFTSGSTVVIDSGQLVFTAAPAVSAGTIAGNTAKENSWAISADSLTVLMDIGTPTWQQPLPVGNAHFGVGIVKDASNCVVFEGGPDNSSTTFTVFVFGIIASVAFASNGTITTTDLPDALGFSLIGNIVKCYVSFAGVWRLVTELGTAGSVDVSGQYDFTAPGALTGWNPGFIWGQNAGPATPSTIAAERITYTTPAFDPSGLVPVPIEPGETLTGAISGILGAGYTVGTITTHCSDDVPFNTVISFSPASGVPGTPIDLVVSSGSCSTPTVHVYGKFAGSKAFPPTLLIDANGLKPRIYMPKENTTVKT